MKKGGLFLSFQNITVIIPSLNPDEKLMKTIIELEQSGFKDIVVVDDGSAIEYKSNFPNIDEHQGCTLLVHEVNKGKGAALKTAFKYCLENRPIDNGVVTIDSDGQHLVKDIIACVEEMQKNDKVVLGCRDFSEPQVPPRSRFGNKTTSLVFRLFCGLKISDTQTGLRAIPGRYLEGFIEIKGDRYEYETNMLLEMQSNHIEFSEVKISTVYINDNETSHFRPIVDSFKIYKLIFAFAFSSVFCMLVEVVIFYLAMKFIFSGDNEIVLSACFSRVLSAIVNFSLNRKQVFYGKGNIWSSLLRYAILAIALMLCSGYLTTFVTSILHIEMVFLITIIKVMVDTALFLISFRVQRGWVFANTKGKEKL